MSLTDGAALVGWAIYVVLAWYIHIFFHEAGHAVVGELLGLRVVTFEAGIFKFKRVSLDHGMVGSWQHTLSRRRAFSGYTGMRSKRLGLGSPALRYGLAVASGPLASAFLAVAAGCIGLLLPRIPPGFPAVFIVLGGAILGMTVIPARGVRFETDGRVVLRLIASSTYREGKVETLMFVERLRKFKADFAAGNTLAAANELDAMERACRIAKGDILRRLVGHLREHLQHGSSMEDCGWSLADPTAEGTYE